MPSGRKSRPPSSSRRANHASASKGCFFSGSRITLSPTLLTRTSVPSKQNSSGSSTACERPCMKSLVIDVISHTRSMVSTNDKISRYQARPSIRPAASAAARPTLPRPPHPMPNVRDDHDTSIWGPGQLGIFLRGGGQGGFRLAGGCDFADVGSAPIGSVTNLSAGMRVLRTGRPRVSLGWRRHRGAHSNFDARPLSAALVRWNMGRYVRAGSFVKNARLHVPDMKVIGAPHFSTDFPLVAGHKKPQGRSNC